MVDYYYCTKTYKPVANKTATGTYRSGETKYTYTVGTAYCIEIVNNTKINNSNYDFYATNFDDGKHKEPTILQCSTDITNYENRLKTSRTFKNGNLDTCNIYTKS